MNLKLFRIILDFAAQKLLLIVLMFMIGIFTFYASINTFEVIANKDVKFSNAIKDVGISKNGVVKKYFLDHSQDVHNIGSFGVPKKIKLPESNRHIDIAEAVYDFDSGSWSARKGVAHRIITSSPRKKVFGQAVIYLRSNTATTKILGEVFSGDIVNIVTTEGWQLGYQVIERGKDPSELSIDVDSDESEIIVIMIDDISAELSCFRAKLHKVGERV